MTKSQLFGRDSWLLLKISRKSLRARFLFTAFPTRREVIIPMRRNPSFPEIAVDWNCRKKCRQRKILPRSLTLRKSLCRRSRCSLLKRILPLGSKAFATLSSPRSNYSATASCCHACTKTEFACTFNPGGSIGRFHLRRCLILYLAIWRKGVKGKWV